MPLLDQQGMILADDPLGDAETATTNPSQQGTAPVLMLDGNSPWSIELAQQAQHCTLIAITFLSLADGRPFSLARLLRLHAYHGPLRACGAISQDRIALMAACGFDQFVLPPLSTEALQAIRDEISAPSQRHYG